MTVKATIQCISRLIPAAAAAAFLGPPGTTTAVAESTHRFNPCGLAILACRNALLWTRQQHYLSPQPQPRPLQLLQQQRSCGNAGALTHLLQRYVATPCGVSQQATRLSSSSSSLIAAPQVLCRSFASAGEGGQDGRDNNNNKNSSSSSSSSSRSTRDMAIVFTCAKCDTRAVKAFSKQAYEKGLVLVKCPGCQSLHLIADHLGWFGDTGFKVDEYLESQGQAVKRLGLDTAAAGGSQAEVTVEDLAGWSQVQALLSTVAAATQATQQDCSSSSQTSSSSSTHSESSVQGKAGCGSPASSAAAAAATTAAQDAGVVAVAPADVAAWMRVRQQQQQQQEE